MRHELVSSKLLVHSDWYHIGTIILFANGILGNRIGREADQIVLGGDNKAVRT